MTNLAKGQSWGRKISICISIVVLSGCEAFLFGPGNGALDGCPTGSSTRVRRVTRVEFDNSTSALLGRPVTFGADLAIEDRVLGYDNHDQLAVGQLVASQLQTAGQKLADAALSSPAIATCSSTNDLDCARSFIDTFTPRAFRRPVTQAEKDDLLALYKAGKDGSDFNGGINLVLQGIFQSGSFLYKTELGADDGRKGTIELTQHEIATALSYLVTASTPDALLTAAADRGELTDPDVRVQHVTRLLKDDRARLNTRSFVMQWFGLNNLGSLQKDNQIFPDFNPALRSALKSETETFIDAVMFSGDAKLKTLLTANFTYADNTVATFYGLTARPGTSFARVSLPNERTGILNQAALLATYAHNDATAPVLRGKMVRTQVLCREMPPPPPNVVNTPPPPDGVKTTRQRLADHVGNGSCQDCHRLIDPIGLGFEDFDGLGKFRTIENNAPVNASGSLPATGDTAHEGSFTGGAALARLVAENTSTGSCAPLQLFRYSVGRVENDNDQCALDEMRAAFDGNAQDFRAALAGLVHSQAFIRREVK